ncbi:uncharacterized protein PG986_005361 [Apiospora aurea]|uniref:DUF7730 domain-containing protein n=1 Tax=Apiospora aurea TaxID=335848 RepID=A0ABR1QHB6_9PEZI
MEILPGPQLQQPPNQLEQAWVREFNWQVSQRVNRQEASPLFDRLPTELRIQIYKYTLTEEPPVNVHHHQFAVRFDHDDETLTPRPSFGTPSATRNIAGFDWVRPENPSGMVTYVGLLQTCKRVYQECVKFEIPWRQREHRFYFYRGLPRQTESEAQTRFERFFSTTSLGWSLVPDRRHRDMIRAIRVFPQMYWLEDKRHNNLIWVVSNTDWFSNVETFQMTFRRGDWWYWERNEALKINPFRNGGRKQQMHQDMVTMQQGGQVPFADKAWGLAFEKMPKLRSLIIDFETSRDKRQEMEEIVKWAQKWKFPAAAASGESARHFSAENNPVEKMSWQGMTYHWSDRCIGCHKGRWQPINPDCPDCNEEKKLTGWGYGPRLLVWTLSWSSVPKS